MKNFKAIRHERERQFVLSFFDHTMWEYSPLFRLSNGKKYYPDFKDNLRNVIIEVVGSRQAFSSNKKKYARFIKEYPDEILEFRDQFGNLLEDLYQKIKIEPISEDLKANRYSIPPPNNLSNVQLMIYKLLGKYGHHQTLADALDIHFTYVYKLEKGLSPGKYLYWEIYKLYDQKTREY